MENYANYELTDEQWKRIQPLLPPENTGKKGRPRKDDRTMLNGMLWMNHSGGSFQNVMDPGKAFTLVLPSGGMMAFGRKFLPS